MVACFRTSGWAIGLALLCAAAATARADGLPAGSPFLPANTGGDSPGPSQDAQLELRGIMAAGDTVMFSIYDTAKKASVWARLNETGRDFVVRSYDPSRDTVAVEHQGRTLTLPLHTAKVVSAPANMPQPGPVVGTLPAPQPVGGPVVLNPTPADEQRRLEAIAAEVNRRRMIRQQALQASRQAGGQPVRPAPPPPNQNGVR